jgi:hypothetical protein
MALAYSRHIIRFCCLAGADRIANVRVQGDEITGEWTAYPRLFYGPSARSLRDPLASSCELRLQMVEDFANWDPTRVLEFTKKYGPLNWHPNERDPFHIRLDDWRQLQRQFRDVWDHLSPRPGRPIRFLPVSIFTVEPTETLDFLWGELTYTASTLYRFLLLELYAIPPERLRTCARPDCPNPRFVARRMGQNYCAEPCAVWGRRQSKLEWWNRVGRKRREKAQTDGKRRRSSS